MKVLLIECLLVKNTNKGRGIFSWALISFLITVIACNNKKEEIFYFDDKHQQVEAIVEVRDGKPDGHTKKFYQSGGIKEESNWKNGLLDGILKYYREDGTIDVKHYYSLGKLVRYESFYANGATKEIFEYKDNSVIDVKRFDDKGKMLEMEPSIFDNSSLINSGDTLKILIRMDNLPSQAYLNGTLIIGRNLYAEPWEYVISDTLAVVKSNDNLYRYNLISDRSGIDSLCFQIKYNVADSVQLFPFCKIFKISKRSK
jgi:hypothetical protein